MNLHSRVVDALGREIVDGTIASGAVLVPEAVGERFGVSRSVVRESLRALESMGMTSARPQVGTRVLPSERWNLLHPQIVEWRGRGADYLDQVEQVLEVRFGIELVAARLATRRMDDTCIAAMRSAVFAMDAATHASEGTAYLEADAEFHRLLYSGVGNPIIAQFSETLAAVNLTRRRDPARTMSERTRASVDQHRALVVALEARDAAAAETASRAVVSHTLEDFRAGREADHEV